MKRSFVAVGLPVLNLSYTPDGSGQTIPPEAHIRWPKAGIAVTYADARIGWAMLRRVGDQVLADMEIGSKMSDQLKAEAMMRKLYPATALTIIQWVGDTLFDMRIVELFLTPYPNVDVKILQLGDRLVPKPRRSEMN